jgi:hypothetical protein
MSTASAQTHLLKNKRAVIFGAGGAVGTAVAKESWRGFCLRPADVSAQDINAEQKKNKEKS